MTGFVIFTGDDGAQVGLEVVDGVTVVRTRPTGWDMWSAPLELTYGTDPAAGRVWAVLETGPDTTPRVFGPYPGEASADDAADLVARDGDEWTTVDVVELRRYAGAPYEPADDE